VESTLLQTFTRGTSFVRTAPFVFQDTLAGTIRYLDLGVHIDNETDRVSDFINGGVKTVGWTIAAANVIWTHRHISVISNNFAKDYKVLIALHLRVNGASDLFARMRKEFNKSGTLPKGDVIGIKVREFIDRHVHLAAYLDTLQDPRDSVLPPQYRDVASFGPTDYVEDRQFIKIDVKTLPLERTPLEVIRLKGWRSASAQFGAMFREPTEVELGRISRQIRERETDSELNDLFVECGGPNDETCAFDYYYPIRMKTPDECRAHSWYLACLVMINVAYGEMHRVDEKDDEEKSENEEEEDEDDEEETDNKLRHALHLIMGSFVPLFYHTLLQTERGMTDEDWRPKPDGRPTLFDKHFPCDTACFHAGDLPNLSGLLEQIGMYGVQVVKNKIPLVRAIIKSLPICCQSRDLAKCFIDECRAANGEGYWRVVRCMFFCTMCGLYPHSKRRADFRSMMRVYEMLFQAREKRFVSFFFYSCFFRTRTRSLRRSSTNRLSTRPSRKRSTPTTRASLFQLSFASFSST
jgi:hypothetical protein